MRIKYNMTYEEYKSNNEEKPKNKILYFLLNKLLTIIIFTMIVLIISNKSITFRNFLKNEVLDSSLDFSMFNKMVDKVTDIFKSEITLPVSSNITSTEPYLDGIKYFIGENENVYAKDSGIVTKIENKEGYNNTIVIQQSNGKYAWYGNIKEKVKLYDYVESGSVLGISSDEYYYVLLNE